MGSCRVAADALTAAGALAAANTPAAASTAAPSISHRRLSTRNVGFRRASHRFSFRIK